MNRIIPKLAAMFTIKPKLFKLILNFDATSWCLYYNGKKCHVKKEDYIDFYVEEVQYMKKQIL